VTNSGSAARELNPSDLELVGGTDSTSTNASRQRTTFFTSTPFCGEFDSDAT
jgi:hypothetical protein